MLAKKVLDSIDGGGAACSADYHTYHPVYLLPYSTRAACVVVCPVILLSNGLKVIIASVDLIEVELKYQVSCNTCISFILVSMYVVVSGVSSPERCHLHSKEAEEKIYPNMTILKT